MKHYKIIYRLFILLLVVTASGCKKDWLDKKPNIALVVPDAIEDYQALLDNQSKMNGSVYPGLGEVATDDYYLLPATWNTLVSIQTKNSYVWADEIYEPIGTNEWNLPYQTLFYANLILEGHANLIVKSADRFQELNNLKGGGLFFRAAAHYGLAQLFCKPYIKASAAIDLGIQLKLKSDVKAIVHRVSVADTYKQIVSDLTEAAPLLPVTQAHKTRPNRPGTYALLSRVYLSMEEYEKALQYADSALKYHTTLLDFNNIVTAGITYPIAVNNAEEMMTLSLSTPTIFSTTRHIVSPDLYSSYVTNDLRQSVFFISAGGFMRFRGSYCQNSTLYWGLATDEVYLIRAECQARLGHAALAMQDLNTLLVTRWKKGTFVNYTATDAEDALRKVLAERRKELCFRGLRWSDLRRLNRDNRFKTTLTRVIDNTTYTLLPESNKYVFPIPQNEILASKIEQNPR